jgi:hypothetical protein
VLDEQIDEAGELDAGEEGILMKISVAILSEFISDCLESTTVDSFFSDSFN